MTKAAKQDMARMIGELADIASAKDIDAALMLGKSMCSLAGIKWETVPVLVELSNL